MTTARDIMTKGTEYLKDSDTAADAARKLSESDIGALPVCRADGHLVGMVTDRDIVVKVVAAGKDPSSFKLSELADQPEVVTIGADDAVEEAVEMMKKHQIRRLPVIDGNEVVGMVSQADLARSLDADAVGQLVAAISDS